MKLEKIIAVVAVSTALCACAVGPDYVAPKIEAPVAFKELQNWKSAEPRDHEFRGKWWEVFGDPVLNSLEEQVNISNQNLVQAEARFRQAAALVQSARAGFSPRLSAEVSAVRSRNSSSRSSSSSSGSVTEGTLALDAAWEADVWGRVRRTVEASDANLQASASDLEAARLSAQAELALNYFQLRVTDTEKQLLDDTIAGYEKLLKLTMNQYEAGVATKAEVIQARTQLKTTQAQAIDLGVQRAQLEHAIALLVGTYASSFSIAPRPLVAILPDIPVGLPSELLERRPDVAAAERRVAAANAKIGVAKSAFFPAVTLSASGGVQSSGSGNWFNVPIRFWSVGAAIFETLFDAGLRKAQSEQALAVYDENVAVYRQVVLNSFREAEDNLAALRILEQEADVQNEAVASARQSVVLTTNQYTVGTVSYLSVVTVQTVALNNERTALRILDRRLRASVLLIKALGGDWRPRDLP